MTKESNKTLYPIPILINHAYVYELIVELQFIGIFKKNSPTARTLPQREMLNTTIAIYGIMCLRETVQEKKTKK